MAPEALALFVRSETHRLAQYLATLRALPRDGTAIQVLVVAPPGERARFERELESDARLIFRTVDTAEAARAAGLKRRRVPGAEALYLHLAAKKPPREQFANRDDRRRYFVWQLQRAIVAARCCRLPGPRAGLPAPSGSRRSACADDAEMQARGSASALRTSTGVSLPPFLLRRRAPKTCAPPCSSSSASRRTPRPVEPAFAHVSRVLADFPQFESTVSSSASGRSTRASGRSIRASRPPAQSRTHATLRCAWRSPAG